ncbi:hypothetical protein TSAR_012253 [Trichomalopsis sarcophagae]|uniref:Uncharacterized protein n=1 Tax=Trichomalopsis sarcophagae TaxID=543379 RepID=A0A232FA53_9HYME|nr:hypothetical protein TSAR_012253 [Trichomalopsis sarcophagae]
MTEHSSTITNYAIHDYEHKFWAYLLENRSIGCIEQDVTLKITLSRPDQLVHLRFGVTESPIVS